MDRPIIEMFWAVEYTNGRALPQYDPFLNKENSYRVVDHKNILRLWWIPITPKMAQQFPGTRYNPLLRRQAVDLNGSKGFVTRRVSISIGAGGIRRRVKCYILGIEGGPRREIYPNGSIVNKLVGTASQDVLHHG